MLMRTLGMTLCSFVLLTAVAVAQTYQPGDKVVVLTNAHLTVNGDRVVDSVFPGLTLNVQAVKGKWLWLGQGRPGWLEKRHVVPLNRQAVGRFTARIRRAPRNAAAYQHRATVWTELGEYELALADLDEGMRLSPSDSAFYNSRGGVHRRRGEYAAAIADYNTALRFDPNSATYYANRARSHYNLDEYDLAIRDCNEAIRLASGNCNDLQIRGAAWFMKGEYDRAIADCSKAIQLNSQHVLAYGQRARAYYRKQEYRQAIKDFEKALKLAPTETETVDRLANALNKLAWQQATDTDPSRRVGEQAVRDATRACVLTGWSVPNYIDTLAAACAEASEFENAVKWQTKAMELVAADSKDDFRSRLTLYESGQPYREQPKDIVLSQAD